MDFIAKLPKSGKYDTILTIMNHDCTKAAIFISCQETIMAEAVATLYLLWVHLRYDTGKSHNRSGYKVHIKVCQRTMWCATNQAEHINGLPPMANPKEPVPWNIPQVLLQRKARWLAQGWMQIVVVWRPKKPKSMSVHSVQRIPEQVARQFDWIFPYLECTAKLEIQKSLSPSVLENLSWENVLIKRCQLAR